jgi:hypothetical protein
MMRNDSAEFIVLHAARRQKAREMMELNSRKPPSMRCPSKDLP